MIPINVLRFIHYFDILSLHSMKSKRLRNSSQKYKLRKSRKGGLFYRKNKRKTFEDNYENWRRRWSKTNAWNPLINWPGITNIGMEPSVLSEPLRKREFMLP